MTSKKECAKTSVPPRATLKNIIKDLFENEVIKADGMKEYYIFSDLNLTDVQQKMLIYPAGFTPMNIFILQQVNSYIGKNFKTALSMTSFVKNGDGYIYGYYFDILDQPAFEMDTLVLSKCPITLVSEAKFNPLELLEAYNNVGGMTVILSLQKSYPYATLQYRHCTNYYYEVLTPNGISSPQYPETKLLGSSTNLKRYYDCKF